jgi:hypothetical protein
MNIEKTYKLSKKLREDYGSDWPSGRLKILIDPNFKESGIALTSVKIGKRRRQEMYVCNTETWSNMPPKMKKGFEKIM